mmetsp:Transcript_13110/g.33764  ORF Transcript_13110/g.33764 Transcript_13110/m.33764 type:complete len:514 (-) Transcript_13110:114-1655(-)
MRGRATRQGLGSARRLALALLGAWVLIATVMLWPSPVIQLRSCLVRERVVWAPHVVLAAHAYGTVAAYLRIDAHGRLAAVAPATRAEAEVHAREQALPFEPHDGSTISPGVVDARVQLASPGRDWEGYAHGTRAAVAGGVTTVVDGPFGSDPPATGKHELQLHMRAAATSALSSHVGFLAGLTPSLARDALGLFALAGSGALGFYAVLSPMHDAAGARPLAVDDLRVAAETISRTGLPLLVRAELASFEQFELVRGQALYEFEADRMDPLTHLRTRPAEWQTAALQELARIAKATSALRLHLTDIARLDDDALPLLADARAASNGRLTADTAPHYLAFDALSLRWGDTHLKAEPAIGDESSRARLWELLGKGEIDMVASGHAPCSDELRADGDFVQAWAGVSGLQFIMQATWTEARLRGHSVGELARWLSAAPAALLGLTGRKGELREGADADFVVHTHTHIQTYIYTSEAHADTHTLEAYPPHAHTGTHTGKGELREGADADFVIITTIEMI